MRAIRLVVALGLCACAEPREDCRDGQHLVRRAGLVYCAETLDASTAPDVVSSKDVSPPPDAPSMACPGGLSLCGAFCRDTTTDESNCGACGQGCSSTEVCTGGRCVGVAGCTAPRMMCGVACTDTSSDNNHCGACDNECPVGTVCSGGRCVCPVGQTLCGMSCVNMATDGSNCGACGRTCATGQVCNSGQCMTNCAAPRRMCGTSCVDVASDIAHCGACNMRCGANQLCMNGACVTPCPPPSVTCNRTCTDVTSDLANCGACGRRCTSGQACVSGACTTPVTGVAGRACQRDADCGTGGACLPTGQGFPNGYCIYGCGAGARPGSACAGGTGICVPTSPDQPLICFRNCTPRSTGQCRTDYICLDISTDGTVGVCYPRCTFNPGAVCGAYRCNALTGECIRGTCTFNAQCSTGSVCNEGECECSAMTSCGTGNRCYPRASTTPAYCACATNAGCANGEMCDTSTGRCL